MKRNLTKPALVISIITLTMSLSAYSQNCQPKTIVFPKNSNTVTLKGNTKGCTNYLLKNRKNQRLQVKLTAPSSDVYFFMNQANATKEEMEGDWFCEDCKTLDYYFDDAENWKIWIEGYGAAENKAINYTLTLKLTAAPPIIAAGILNGKAISLPKPIYPKEADAKESVFTPKGDQPQNAAKTVTVEVLLNEDGGVYNAEAVSGNELFYQAATEAAMGAKFKPTFVNGKAVRVSGVLVYNFK